jgi:hypothetical protein
MRREVKEFGAYCLLVQKRGWPMVTGEFTLAMGLLSWSVNKFAPLAWIEAQSFKWSPSWWHWIIVGLCFMAYAQFRVWRDEHRAGLKGREERQKLEETLNSKADMQGTVWTEIATYGAPPESFPSDSILKVKCVCTNYGRVGCEISRLLLVLDRGTETEFRFMHFLPLVDVKWVIPQAQFVLSSAQIPIRDVSPGELSKRTVHVYLADSMNGEYPKMQMVRMQSQVA